MDQRDRFLEVMLPICLKNHYPILKEKNWDPLIETTV